LNKQLIGILSTTPVSARRKTSWSTACCGQASQDSGHTEGLLALATRGKRPQVNPTCDPASKFTDHYGEIWELFYSSVMPQRSPHFSTIIKASACPPLENAAGH